MKGKPKPETNGKPATLSPGVAYIRMSSDQQEASPDQQRAEVVKLAEKHGYKIIREYFDSGISGAATAKRKQFLAMMQDAETKGDFKAILCWDQDRFGRFDSIEAGRWVHPLRERGIQLVTVAQGVIDWSDFAGRMIYSIHQEGKAQYLQDLSRNVCRGLMASAKTGNGVNKPPYGFDRLFFDAAGKLVQRVPYGQKFRRPKGWACKLAISEDAEAVESVRWMFETFAETDCSAQSLAIGLNKQGRRTAAGVAWRHDVILDMLRNPMYAGTYAYGRHRCGKFHHIGADGSATPQQEPQASRTRADRHYRG
ncbi:MAG TPA: recombinase family protein [Pirellulales bacterium]|nr:recombinase family protein [Pirellulales bacterium]